MRVIYISTFLSILLQINEITCQAGPDPWNSGNIEGSPPTKRKTLEVKSNGGIGEWSFKRLLAIIMKPSRNKNIENDIDIHLQMKFSREKWRTLEEYLKSNATFSEDMFRRALGYVEEAIYKPTFKETIVMAWSDYVVEYMTQYKTQIIWTLSALTVTTVMLRVWNKLTSRHVKIMAFVLLYCYEGAISYMEAEQQEFQRFVSAVNSCKWYFWRSDCDVQPLDILVFWKYMNPAKIGIRMITNWITEPIVCLSSAIKTILHDVTDGLWFPFDKVVYFILIVAVYIMLISFVITVTFNFIFNIPFSLNFLYGLGSIHIPQRNRTLTSHNRNDENQNISNANSIDKATLDKILNICSHAVQSSPNIINMRVPALAVSTSSELPKIKRSASTGRLANLKMS